MFSWFYLSALKPIGGPIAVMERSKKYEPSPTV